MRMRLGVQLAPLALLLALQVVTSGARPLQYAMRSTTNSEFVNPFFLVRRSLADSLSGASALPPASAPSLSPVASTVTPSGASLQAPIGSASPEEGGGDGHHLKKGVLATIILVPTLVCGSILISSYVSFDSIKPRLAKAFGRDDEFSDSAPTPLPPYHDGRVLLPPKATQRFQPEREAKAPQPMDYDLLERATNGFDSSNQIGEGGFARVYKAQLDDEHVVAVKKLSTENDKADEEFQSEVELMKRIHHSNLVALIGFSSRGEERLLVYELMRNGSLQDQLQGPAQGAALTWHLRLKIALDAARGLEYLHDHCNPPVIHRDFKSSNILLDSDFNAKLSDFGLALLLHEGTGKNGSLQLQGTFGYVAPEYILTGILTEKSDVYAFGVVLLELITGRKPIDMSMPTGCQSLVTWATPQLTDRTRLPLIVDAAIKDTVNLKQLFQVAAVAVLCVQSEPSYRPLIGDVVNSLIPLVPCEMGGALRVAADPGLNCV